MVDYDSVGLKEILSEVTPFSKKLEGQLKKAEAEIKQNFRSDDYRHYLFTPRDLNCVAECLKLYSIDFSKEEETSKALLHELYRQFGDRLVNEEAKLKFGQLMEGIFGLPQPSFYTSIDGQLALTTKEHFAIGIRSTAEFYERDTRDMQVVLVDEVLDLYAAI